MSRNIRSFSPQEAQNIALGLGGREYNDGTSLHTGNYIALYVQTTTVFATIDGEDLSTWEFSKGEWIFGEISSYQLNSGKVIAYKAE